MNWPELRQKLEPAKDWIIKNQSDDGSICWDEKGKCDPWDHCECLIALAIYEEWDAWHKGVNWFLENINQHGLIFPEFQNQRATQMHFESHHAPYISLALMQASLIDKKQIDYLSKKSNFKEKIDLIFNELNNFRDEDGYYFWAKDKKGYSDNSLITATMSILLSIKANDISKDINFDTLKWSKKFNRDGQDRSRFSMDFYYPFLAGIKKDKSEFKKVLKSFYVEGLGVKCVKEEPWVTFAESSECVLAALVNGNENLAEEIFKNLLQFQNSEGIFPTGYQYDLKIFWPDEKSTWTNAAVIIAGHALCTYRENKIGTGSNVFINLSNS